MKKSILGLAALALLASCNNDEELNSLAPEAITFGNPFVDNATRAIDPSYGTKKVDSFQVWGTVAGNQNQSNPILVYNGATVSRGDKEYGVAWNCTQKEYWIPSATYQFIAIANATSVAPTTGMPTSISFTNDGTKDLILSKVTADGATYGAKTVTTNPQSVPETGVNTNKIVDFTFGHLLSKVKFQFTNNSGSDKYTYKISNVQVKNAFKTGTFNISGTQGWTGQATANDFVLNFGNAVAADATAENVAAQSIANGASATSNYERLLIPGNQTLTITFTETLLYNGTAISSFDREKTLEHNFAQNGNYTITATLKPGNEISFTITNVGPWTPGEGGGNVNL